MRRKNNKISIPDKRVPGVYAIINKDAHKCYIGSSKDIKYRIITHLSMLDHGRHYSKEMQKDYNNNHKFEVVVLFETNENSYYSDERKCMEDYFISCLIARGIELYNSPKHGKYEHNFFLRASFIDKRILNLREKIKSEL